MIRNEANWDRAVRVVLGLALLSMALTGPHNAWGLVGIVPLATGLAGYCPLYQLVGVSTCPAPRPRS
jgi:hypothetical protein